MNKLPQTPGQAFMFEETASGQTFLFDCIENSIPLGMREIIQNTSEYPMENETQMFMFSCTPTKKHPGSIQ